jgi:hypothetical protein
LMMIPPVFIFDSFQNLVFDREILGYILISCCIAAVVNT